MLVNETKRFKKTEINRWTKRRKIEPDIFNIAQSSSQLSLDFIKRYFKKLPVVYIYLTQKSIMNIDYLRENKDRFQWSLLSANPFITREVIIEFADKINWVRLLRKGRFIPQDMLDILAEKVDDIIFWKMVSQRCPMRPEFMKKYSDKLDEEMMNLNPYLAR